ncbi:hypothetical protein C8J56DRAFT_64082 [Mycena floridula]|nr:hypothetical protein C8J56DRAFT_64082 [Mycena floridula]
MSLWCFRFCVVATASRAHILRLSNRISMSLVAPFAHQPDRFLGASTLHRLFIRIERPADRQEPPLWIFPPYDSPESPRRDYGLFSVFGSTILAPSSVFPSVPAAAIRQDKSESYS